MHTILFLCTGNYYRSRFAEHLFNARAVATGLPWAATSRGLAIELGIFNLGPVAAVALQALEARGVAVAHPLRMPMQAQAGDFVAARRVIALHAAEHRPLMLQRYPAWAEAVEYWHVPDVGEMTATMALDLIDLRVADLITELHGGS